MFNLDTTQDLIERLSIVEELPVNLRTFRCRRCKVLLTQQMFYEKGEIEIVWKCPNCSATIRESP